MIVAFAFALGWVIGFLTGSCFVVLIARIAVKQGKLWIVHSPSRRVPASVEVELLNSLIDTLEADNARLREAIRKRHDAAVRFLTVKTTDIGDPESNAALSDLAEAEAELDRIAREGK